MSQDTLDIPTTGTLSGLALVQKINSGQQALASNSSGSTPPSKTYPCQFWVDTSTNRLRMRNVANTAWIDMGDVTLPNFGIMQPGTILILAHPNAANGCLKCNGAAVSRTVYKALFDNIGTTYGVGDGSTTFNLPELRGEFIRVFDDGRGVDAGRTLGSGQAQQIIQHQHNADSGTNGFYSDAPGLGIINTGGSILNITRSAWTGSVTSGPAVGSETRPRNVALPAYIKY
ncbi:phage tail protein [Cupriavidus pauculus]|uniref:phage tail protein n=1 Tax=Cupriavidus pauculus TaxID=82633 RepID=UPI0030F80364